MQKEEEEEEDCRFIGYTEYTENAYNSVLKTKK